jgi:hypothetical protein
MGQINVGRVVAGGLLAGLVISISEFILNMYVVAAPMEEALKAHNLPAVGGGAIGVFVLLCFGLGISLVWLYAAIRPRYGAGPRTALCAAAAVWWFAFVFPQIGNVAMGLFPAGVTAVATMWGLAEVAIAAVAGARLYQERPSPAGTSSRAVI